MSQIANVLASDNDVAPRVREVLPGMEDHPLLAELMDLEVPAALKPVVDPKDYAHRSFRDDEFWRHIPGFADVDRATFLDWKFQNKHSITSVDKLAVMLGNLVSPAFLDDVRAGIARAPMNVRISPYTVSLINWADPYRDPLRIQFLPVASTQLPDHPRLTLDSLHEQRRCPHARSDPPLLRQGAVPAARRLPGLLPLLHAQLRDRRRHRHRPEGPSEARPETLACRNRLHRLAPRDRGHRGLRRRRLYAAGRPPQHHRPSAAGDPAHPPHPHRDQGSGRGADEDTHRRGLDRRAVRRRQCRPRDGQGSLPPHPLQLPARDHRDHAARRWSCCSRAASPCATRPS